MKQWIKGLIIGMMALVLVACADKADVKPGTKATNTSDLTIAEVFEQAREASEKTESMQADMSIKQNMTSEAIGIDMNTDISVVLEMIKEPLSMHQLMEVGIDEGDIETMQTEVYLTDEGLFMKEPMSEGWMSLPIDLFEDISASMGVGDDPSLDLSSLKEFIDDFTFEQNDEHYILTLNGSGEKFKALMLDELESTGITAGMGEDESEILENMIIHQLDYELFIDKKTFDTTAFNLSMDMEIGEEGEEIRIAQDIVAVMSRINDIQNIEVPKEVLDSAVES